jgi:hypothetical protein
MAAYRRLEDGEDYEPRTLSSYSATMKEGRIKEGRIDEHHILTTKEDDNNDQGVGP